VSGGPTTLPILSVADGEFLRRVGSDVDGVSEAGIVAIAGGSLIPPLPVLGDNWLAWHVVSALNTGSQALTADRVWLVPHFEERGLTYDALMAWVAATSVGGTIRLGIYGAHATTKLPATLWFTSANIDTSSAAGAKTTLFSAGTWDAALPASHKNGSNQFTPPRGLWCWFAFHSTGSANMRTTQVGGLYPIGKAIASDPYTCLEFTQTFASGLPAAPGALTPRSQQHPVSAFRFVS
jgi:hypothetical protein